MSEFRARILAAAKFDEKPIHYIGDQSTDQALYSKQGRAYENARLLPLITSLVEELDAAKKVLERISTLNNEGPYQSILGPKMCCNLLYGRLAEFERKIGGIT